MNTKLAFHASSIALGAGALLGACSATVTTLPYVPGDDGGPPFMTTPDGAADGATPYDDGSTYVPPDASSGPSATQACGDFASAYCARFAQCSPFLFQATWGDAATCRARTSLGCPADLVAAGTTWTPAGVESCVATLPAASCQQLAGLGKLPAACAPMGSRAQGAACAADMQCATAHCAFAVNSACGQCRARATAGGFCTFTTDCADGLACNGQSSCTAYGTQGAACDSYTPCAPWLACKSGSCQQGDPAGTPCGQDPSLPDTCDQFSGVFCSSLLMQCMQSQVVPAGGNCGGGAGTVVCAGGGYCDGVSCQPAATEGQSCYTTGGLGATCLSPAQCVNGQCKDPDPAACK